jgi:HK97 gp10 family phage protein
MDHAKHAALEKVGAIVEDGAKKAIGTYEFGWPPLAQSTIDKKGADTPLLETGKMRDSIRHEVSGDTVRVGSDVEYALYQEVGTVNMPPRPFLQGSAVHHKHEITHAAGQTMVAKLLK